MISRKLLTILKISREKKIEKRGIVANRGNDMGEHVERDSLIVLDDVSGFANRSPSYFTFMKTCRKFSYNLLYVFCETAISSSRWKDILSQTQVFCVFPSTMDLEMNYLVKFVSRSDGKGYASRQQLWLSNLV